ncbi:FXYD domain-containing ion transport regulator 5 isoform X3 [Erinaceus europaeus]|nr:FXYD domain-containing ion transport regulator 5 isoform X3 [Erinaceus europaeus]XP_060041710.1 FXYD domain-containing ion transport regulator 5 isoform X3 [Erinaceus europaeus]XP_060041711.1 FXYD domain-containing ion transport regulator 5 isoform X3 [Erinaceus europaeus]
MSPSGRLCLLVVLALMLPATGQDTPIPPTDSITVSDYDKTPVLVQTPGTGHLEEQSTPPNPPPQPEEETTLNPRESLTLSLTERDVLLTPTTGKDTQSTQGTTPSKKQTPDKDSRMNPAPQDGSTGSNEENPFYYDVYTLRKRGLLIAAVLFITGIVILTSGKCRQLPQLCQKNRR